MRAKTRKALTVGGLAVGGYLLFRNRAGLGLAGLGDAASDYSAKLAELLSVYDRQWAAAGGLPENLKASYRGMLSALVNTGGDFVNAGKAKAQGDYENAMYFLGSAEKRLQNITQGIALDLASPGGAETAARARIESIQEQQAAAEPERLEAEKGAASYIAYKAEEGAKAAGEVVGGVAAAAGTLAKDVVWSTVKSWWPLLALAGVGAGIYLGWPLIMAWRQKQAVRSMRAAAGDVIPGSFGSMTANPRRRRRSRRLGA